MTIASLLKHCLQLFFQTEKAWESIASQSCKPKQLFLYLLPLLLFMAACNFLGYQFFEQNPLQEINMHLFAAGATFVFSLLYIYISALMTSQFAHFTIRTERFKRAFTLITFSFIPGIIFNSIAFLIPMINYLTIFSLFSFFVLYKGISPMLSIPENRKSGYFTFILIGLLSISAVLGAFFIGIASLMGF
ncbi:YIP1 family protein [Labilibaculum sp.]|uniref:YIP1 family protein n=1 Tax=Labilibaculum sp. TaxID=2060723 RepID=UPI003562646F